MKRNCLMVVLLSFVGIMAVAPSLVAAHGAHAGKSQGTMGAGHFLVADTLDVEFSFFAFRRENGSVIGSFHHRTNDGLGVVDFKARVTCVAVDPVQKRAWVGGVITENNSSSPDYLQDNNKPGHDIWFRVLQGGDEPSDQGRSTFIGFEGAIASSTDYCAQRPWPDGNARTWPVTEGHILVHGPDGDADNDDN